MESSQSRNGIVVQMTHLTGEGIGMQVQCSNENQKAITVFNPTNGTAGEDVFRVYADGYIEAKRLRLSLNVWSDYVFEKDYALLSIQELEDYIQANGHLPNIPSTEEVLENGVDMGSMDALLLEKIEEMSLYIIDLQKQVDALKAENQTLKGQ